MRLSSIIAASAAIAIALAASACHSIDDDRVPAYPVNITFTDVGQWNLYGISGALDHRNFIRQQRLPAGYPYSAQSATGFGGVLLIGDVMGNPVAFDLSCPIECRNDVRVAIDPETYRAVCPVCHSQYDVISLPGAPVDGPAAQRGYGLRRYRVLPQQGTAYKIIIN